MPGPTISAILFLEGLYLERAAAVCCRQHMAQGSRSEGVGHDSCIKNHLIISILHPHPEPCIFHRFKLTVLLID